MNVSKRYVIHAAAYNLGVILRKLLGVGTPRSLQGRAAAAIAWALCRWITARTADMRHPRRTPMRLTLSLPQFAAA